MNTKKMYRICGVIVTFFAYVLFHHGVTTGLESIGIESIAYVGAGMSISIVGVAMMKKGVDNE